MTIIQANIDNLTSFWQKAASPFDGCFQSNNINYCYLENSDWPNRLWFGQEITENGVDAAKNQLSSIPKSLTIPYWDIHTSTSFRLLEQAGFSEKFAQIGMSLKLQEWPQKTLRLQFERVLTSAQARLWAEVYPKAFGYRINEEILIKSNGEIEFYLASYMGDPVGTAMIYPTNEVVGVHGIGVIPEKRRQGFAEEIMEFVLNRAAGLHASYVTLQASVMGKGLYDKLGFKEDFAIKNYILNQEN